VAIRSTPAARSVSDTVDPASPKPMNAKDGAMVFL
jgi:hypothetical protein